MQAKIGGLEEEVSTGFTSHLRKKLTLVVVGVVGKKRFLVSFQCRFKKEMISNKLTNVVVERHPDTKEAEVPPISVMPLYCHSVYLLLQF